MPGETAALHRHALRSFDDVIRAYHPGWLTDAEYGVPGRGGLGKLLTQVRVVVGRS